jgi:serine/threonine protein kinase
MNRPLFTDYKGWYIPTHYQVVKFLGKGSYGEVIEACDKLTGKHVAIKRMQNVF